jgi:hypothetical protein
MVHVYSCQWCNIQNVYFFNEQYVLSKEKIVGTRYGQDLGIEVIRRVSELMRL